MAVTVRRGEIAVAVVFVGAALGVLWESSRMPQGSWGAPGPAFVPAMLGIGLLACGVAMLVRAALARNDAPGPAVSLGHPRVWLTVASVVVMAFVLEPVGFIVSGTVFLLVLLRGVGGASWPAAGGGALALTLGAWYFFTLALGVNLPRGILAF